MNTAFLSPTLLLLAGPWLAPQDTVQERAYTAVHAANECWTQWREAAISRHGAATVEAFATAPGGEESPDRPEIDATPATESQYAPIEFSAVWRTLREAVAPMGLIETAQAWTAENVVAPINAVAARVVGAMPVAADGAAFPLAEVQEPAPPEPSDEVEAVVVAEAAVVSVASDVPVRSLLVVAARLLDDLGQSALLVSEALYDLAESPRPEARTAHARP